MLGSCAGSLDQTLSSRYLVVPPSCLGERDLLQVPRLFYISLGVHSSHIRLFGRGHPSGVAVLDKGTQTGGDSCWGRGGGALSHCKLIEQQG